MQFCKRSQVYLTALESEVLQFFSFRGWYHITCSCSNHSDL